MRNTINYDSCPRYASAWRNSIVISILIGVLEWIVAPVLWQCQPLVSVESTPLLSGLRLPCVVAALPCSTCSSTSLLSQKLTESPLLLFQPSTSVYPVHVSTGVPENHLPNVFHFVTFARFTFHEQQTPKVINADDDRALFTFLFTFSNFSFYELFFACYKI